MSEAISEKKIVRSHVYDFSVKLRMVVNPLNTMALEGDTVQLCCQASGFPDPGYYEWQVMSRTSFILIRFQKKTALQTLLGSSGHTLE